MAKHFCSYVPYTHIFIVPLHEESIYNLRTGIRKKSLQVLWKHPYLSHHARMTKILPKMIPDESLMSNMNHVGGLDLIC